MKNVAKSSADSEVADGGGGGLSGDFKVEKKFSMWCSQSYSDSMLFLRV